MHLYADGGRQSAIAIGDLEIKILEEPEDGHPRHNRLAIHQDSVPQTTGEIFNRNIDRSLDDDPTPQQATPLQVRSRAPFPFTLRRVQRQRGRRTLIRILVIH